MTWGPCWRAPWWQWSWNDAIIFQVCPLQYITDWWVFRVERKEILESWKVAPFQCHSVGSSLLTRQLHVRMTRTPNKKSRLAIQCKIISFGQCPDITKGVRITQCNDNVIIFMIIFITPYAICHEFMDVFLTSINESRKIAVARFDNYIFQNDIWIFQT